MKPICRNLALFIAFCLLWTSCKILEPPESDAPGKVGTLYPFVENQQVGFMDEDLIQRISPQFQLRSGDSWPYSF